MALSESAVSDLRDALRVGEDADLVRELAQRASQQRIEVAATEKIGADLWDRSPGRTTYGQRPKVLLTKVGICGSRSRSCARGRSSPSCTKP